ncbi:hypothetical protein FRB91_010158 [Serendipita sp. 411]|nr:hypothetical protein FRB91_010158 [Serendipita sp. 411]
MDHPEIDPEDAQIAAAIAASLESFQERVTRRYDETDTEEDDEEGAFQADLQKAIEASKAEASTSQSKPKAGFTGNSRASNVDEIQNMPSPPSNPATDFLRQRAQLEKERLARGRGIVNVEIKESGKKRSISASESGEDDNDRPMKRLSHKSNAGRQGSDTTSTSYSRKPFSEVKRATEEVFFTHELRQTANRLTNESDIRNGVKTFRISEIIGDKEAITFAILSSYSTDISWVYSFFSSETPVILVNQPRDNGDAEVKNILPNWVMTMPFLRAGRGAMHVKLMLLFYKSGRLRIAIPTANLIDYDWRDIENTAWVQDFPPLNRPIIGKDGNASSFASTLQMVLTKLNIPNALGAMLIDHPNLPLQSVDMLSKGWSFSKATVKLIPSMAGKYEGWHQVLRQGHTALMKAIIDIGAHAGQTKRKARISESELVVECQGSSIGTYSPQWLQEIHSSCSGISPEKWLDKSKASRAKLPTPPIRILFPSLKTVTSSILGTDGGGTMFCRESQWNGANFPRELFHDSNSKRGGVLMHTKMILGLWKPKSSPSISSLVTSKGKQIDVWEEDDDTEEDEDEEIQEIEPNAAGWLYVGSHNFTPSAWGNLSGSSFTPIMNITNYELGVLIPLSEKPTVAEKQANELVSWIRPPRKYDLSKGDKAWCQS